MMIERTYTDVTCRRANADYQTAMARGLLASCGPREALEICRVNQWDGVLRALMVLERRLRPSLQDGAIAA